jgi:hypothetical protein
MSRRSDVAKVGLEDVVKVGREDVAKVGRMVDDGSAGPLPSWLLNMGLNADRSGSVVAEPPVCEWTRGGFGVCDVCNSYICDGCRTCAGTPSSQAPACEKCRVGMQPCLPMCLENDCGW